MIVSSDLDGYIAVGTHGNGLFTAVTGVTDVDDHQKLTPSDFQLSQNYPNPFNPSTLIEYYMPKDGQIKIQIYDMLGNEIKTLIDGDQAAGTYQAVWNGTNNSGAKVSSGSYVYRLVSGDYSISKKMLLMK